MKQVGLLTTDLPGLVPQPTIGLAPQGSTTTFSTNASRYWHRHELQNLLSLGLRLAVARNGSRVGMQGLQGVRFSIRNKFGASQFGDGWIWRTSSYLRVSPGRSVGQLANLIDAFKNSAICHHCHSKLPTEAFACLSSSVNTFGGGGGRRFVGKGGGGGGGGGGDGFEAAAGKGAAAVGGEQSDDVPVGAEGGDDIIILDVGGMSCGGCSASVKRILESQPEVSLANVNLATETAFVQVVRGSQSPLEWKIAKQEVGETLAKHLSSCGFKSTVRETVV